MVQIIPIRAPPALLKIKETGESAVPWFDGAHRALKSGFDPLHYGTSR